MVFGRLRPLPKAFGGLASLPKPLGREPEGLARDLRNFYLTEAFGGLRFPSEGLREGAEGP